MKKLTRPTLGPDDHSLKDLPQVLMQPRSSIVLKKTKVDDATLERGRAALAHLPDLRGDDRIGCSHRPDSGTLFLIPT